jgi:hypothetical protein
LSLIMAVVPLGFKEAEKALQGIQDGYPKAASEAINRGLLAGRTAAAKAIAGRYAIKSADVKGQIETKNATWQHLQGDMTVSGKMLNVGTFRFGVRKVKTAKGTRQMVTATIIKGNKVILKNAFVTKAGKIMERRQPEKYPIFPVSTISIAHMSGQSEVSDAIQKAMNETTNSRLQHNVNRALGIASKEINRATAKKSQQLTAKEAQAK